MNYNTIAICSVVFTFMTICAGSMFLYQRKAEKHHMSFWLKGIASLSFVMIGLVMALYRQEIFGWFIFTGLLFGLIGDQLLALRTIFPKKKPLFFLSGGVAFSVGHIFYIISLWCLGGEFKGKIIFVFFILMISSAVYAQIMKSMTGKKLILGSIYIGFVAFMSAMALSVVLKHSGLGSLLFAIGGFSFFLSDNFLGAYSFGKNKSKFLNIVLHITYYIAQLCIAWSIAFL